MKEKILDFLRANKDYISGEYISRELNISRAAVWKYIDILRKEGYVIDSSSRKGYKLVESAKLLNYSEIKEFLTTKYIGRRVHYLTSVTSTNEVGKTLAEKGEIEGTIIISEEQTKGKGRLGRKWITEGPDSIAASLILKPNISPREAPSITLITAISIVEALHDVTGYDIGIKWPNDVILENKKLCGILTEMNAEMDIVNYIIVGMGLNVNQKSFQDEIENMAISLKSYKGKGFDRRIILSSILNKFEKNYEIFKEKGFIYFIDNYKRYLRILKKRVLVKNINSSYEGEVLDIDSEGCLIIKLDNGEVKRVLSGDVSVRGLYGYVPD